MLKRIMSIIPALILVFFTASCAMGGGADWTIMVWLDGDNDLETFALADLNEMEYGLYMASIADPAITSRVRIIVQVDRHGSYDNSTAYTGDNWSDTRRYLIQPDPSDSTAWTSRRIDEDMGEVNMGDAQNLKEFIEYCQENYHARRYALILWNHGGGIMKKKTYSPLAGTGSGEEMPLKEICTDWTDGDRLYTGEITDLLTDAHSIDLLGFDACYMGMFEVAYEYRPGVAGKFGADAICFSPAPEQADGWDYVRILTRLGGDDSDGDTADPENDPCYDAGAVTAQQFAELCAKEYGDSMSLDSQTQTAVDNTLADEVKAAMDAFASAISQVGGYRSLVEAIRGTGTAVTMHYFNDSYAGNWQNYPFYDLYDFAERVSAESGLSDAHDEATALMTAINSYILYSYAGSSYTGFTSRENGLSFFFTEGDKTYIYNTVEYSYMHGYTPLDISSSGRNYGRLDFCEKGAADNTAENWYELMMEMYIGYVPVSTYWPDAAY